MALVAPATAAVVFRAWHDQLEIHLGADGVGQGLPEARPAGAAVVFGIGAKQRQVAAGAVERTSSLFGVQWAAEGAFGAFFAQHLIGGRTEPLLPLRIAELPLGIGGG